MSGEEEGLAFVVKLYLGSSAIYSLTLAATPFTAGSAPHMRYFLYIFILIFTIGEMVIGPYVVLSYKDRLPTIIQVSAILIVFSLPLVSFGATAYELVYDLVIALYGGLILLTLLPLAYIAISVLSPKRHTPPPRPYYPPSDSDGMIGLVIPEQDAPSPPPPKSYGNGGGCLVCGLLCILPAVVIVLVFLFPLQSLLLLVAREPSTFIYFIFGLVVVFGAVFGLLHRG